MRKGDTMEAKTFERDAAGRRLSVTYPSTYETTYSYDDRGLPDGAGDWIKAGSVERDAAGHPLSWSYGNGAVQTRTWDEDGRRNSLLNADPAGDSLPGFDLTWRPRSAASNPVSNSMRPRGAKRSAYNPFLTENDAERRTWKPAIRLPVARMLRCAPLS